MGSGGGDQQQFQGRSNLPEDVWLEDIDDMYPNLQGQTYFLPPYHFNRVPFTVKDIAGLTARVTAACCQSPQQTASTSQAQGSQQRASTSQAQGYQQVAGNLFVPNPSNLQPVGCRPDYAVDDQAQEKCLHALHDISGEAMMVISELLIRNYLNNKTNPDPHRRHQDAISQLPTPGGLPSNLADGECDILVIHPDRSLLVAEVKSVSNKPSFSDDRIIVKKVEQAIGQLDNLEATLKHLLKDLPGIRRCCSQTSHPLSYVQL